MDGYAEISRPTRNITRSGDNVTFQVLDMKNNTKEIIETNANKTVVKKKKKARPSPHVVESEVDTEEASFLETKQEDKNNYHIPEVRKTIKVFTDITEATIEVVHHYKDDNVICLFMDKDTPTKLNPKKGITLEMEIEGERVNVYSPGLFIPAEPFGVDIVFLLVQGEESD